MKTHIQMKETSDRNSRKKASFDDVEMRRFIEEHMEKQRQKEMEGELSEMY